MHIKKLVLYFSWQRKYIYAFGGSPSIIDLMEAIKQKHGYTALWYGVEI